MLSGRSFPLRTREGGEAASGRWGAGLCRACGIPRCCFKLIPLLTVTVEFALCYSQPPGASVVLSDALYAFRKTFLIQGPPFRLVTETDSSVLPLGCCAPCTCLWSERHWLFPPRARWEPARLHPSGLFCLSFAVQDGVPRLFYWQEPHHPLRWALPVSARA